MDRKKHKAPLIDDPAVDTQIENKDKDVNDGLRDRSIEYVNR